MSRCSSLGFAAKGRYQCLLAMLVQRWVPIAQHTGGLGKATQAHKCCIVECGSHIDEQGLLPAGPGAQAGVDAGRVHQRPVAGRAAAAGAPELLRAP